MTSLKKKIPIAALALFASSSFTLADSALEISEFLAINESGITDQDGDNSDWIEIHNTSSSAVNTLNWGLTDDSSLPKKWTLPSRTIQPDGRLLVFASSKDLKPTQIELELHANFKLSGSGEYLALIEPGGTKASESSPYPQQTADISAGYGHPAGDTSLPEQALIFKYPTPGEEDTIGALGFIKDTRFDVKRGFFDSSFTETVTCATEGVTLVYTTDGSIPTLTNGTVDPPLTSSSPGSLELPISTTTTLRVASIKTGWLQSDIDTQTYIFLDDVLQQDGNNLPPYTTWGDNDQPDWEMDPEIVNDPTWGSTLKNDLKTLPTLSLSMNWDELFGTDGIYIAGDGDTRNCSVEYFVSDDSEPGFHINATVEIQGGSSTNRWKVDKLSMRLKFEDELDTRDMIYSLYPDSPVDEFDSLILGAGHNISWQHSNTNQSSRTAIIREQLISDLQLQMSGNGASHHARYSHLYLNGLYWGLFAIHERTDHHFMASYFGGDDDDYTIIKHNPDEVVNGDGQHYQNLLTQTRKDQSDETNYQKTLETLDVTWLLDYIILNHWAGSYDWAHQNWYASFKHTEVDGKWRFHAWDSEHVMYDLDHMVMDENDTTQVFSTNQQDDTGSPVEIHYNLMENDNYRIAFADRIEKHLKNGGLLTPGNILPSFENRFNEINAAVNAEAARWGDNNEKSNGSKYTKANWTNEIDWMRNTYIPQRSNVVLQQYADKSWYPNAGSVAISPLAHNSQTSVNLTLSTESGNTIYYTTNGSDPRTSSGDIYSLASSTETTAQLTVDQTTTVKARTLSTRGEWGPVNEALYIIGAIETASETNLAVTEISYNPVEPTSSELAEAYIDSNNDFEFIEIMNTLTTATVDLSGVKFDNAILFTFPEDTYLGPQERLVIVSNLAAFNHHYSSLEYAPRIIGSYEGNFGNGGEKIEIDNRDGQEILQVNYSDDAPWPTSPDGDGYTLIYNLSGNDPDTGTNWSGSLALGGSPGSPEPIAYTTWASQSGVIGGPSDDQDKDGITNLAEYYFGTNPTESTHIEDVSIVQLNELTLEITRELHLLMNYQKSTATTGVTAVIEFSTNLKDWTDFLPSELTLSNNHLYNGTADVVVRAPDSVESSSIPQYIRLTIRQ